jgi:DNA polymerase
MTKRKQNMMDEKIRIVRKLKKALEFYQGIGIDHFPVRSEDTEKLLAGLLSDKKPSHEALARCVSESSKEFSNDKHGQLRDLQENMGNCMLCRLSQGRKSIVFGEGNPDADLMFIGEGPGREEDLQCRPFVGEAGKVLNSLIRKMGFKREDVYIANIVKCRPPSNRDPERDEMEACSPFLEKQISIIQPKIIMALGRISAQRLLDVQTPISKMRGRFYLFQGIPVMPTFHPAYLMRNPKDKWLTWEDAQMVIEKLKSKPNA